MQQGTASSYADILQGRATEVGRLAKTFTSARKVSLRGGGGESYGRE
jgi:hypothetical protein